MAFSTTICYDKKVKKILLKIGGIAFLFSLIANVYFVAQKQKEMTVVEVSDGDTFQLASGKRVRLMGVDAPEFERCLGKEAKQKLAGLILNKKVGLKEEVKEAYGRSLALVYLDGKLINKIILENGFGRTDYRKNSQRDVLTAAFHSAQKQKIGIWSQMCRDTASKLAPVNCLIKGNIDPATYEKFYHYPGCSHYEQIIIEKDRGEQYFCTEEEAKAAGFKKAAGCN